MSCACILSPSTLWLQTLQIDIPLPSLTFILVRFSFKHLIFIHQLIFPSNEAICTSCRPYVVMAVCFLHALGMCKKTWIMRCKSHHAGWNAVVKGSRFLHPSPHALPSPPPPTNHLGLWSRSIYFLSEGQALFTTWLQNKGTNCLLCGKSYALNRYQFSFYFCPQNSIWFQCWKTMCFHNQIDSPS